MRNQLLLVPVLTLALFGCDNPTADKPKATVTSASTAASTTSAPAPSAKQEPTATAKPAAPVVLTPPTAPAGALTIDTAASSVGFVGSKVTGKHEGTFTKIAGWILLENGKVEGGKAAIVIDVGSLKTDSEKLDGHLKTPDFFNVDAFPVATFTLTGIKAGGDKGATHTLSGDLDLHGQKKGISFPAKITVAADAVTATAEFSINRKDFGIQYAGMKDDLIKDDVLIKLNIKAPRAK